MAPRGYGADFHQEVSVWFVSDRAVENGGGKEHVRRELSLVTVSRLRIRIIPDNSVDPSHKIILR